MLAATHGAASLFVTEGEFLNIIASESDVHVLDATSGPLFQEEPARRLVRSVHVPQHELFDRSYELPPPQHESNKLCILADDYASALELVAHVVSGTLGPDGTSVRACTYVSEQLKEEALKLGLIETPISASCLHRRLWQPSDAAQQVLPLVASASSHVIDIGGGVGRDCVFAALELGLSCSLLDARDVMCARAASLCNVHGVRQRVQVYQANVNTNQGFERAIHLLGSQGHPVVLMNRFLHRGLLQSLSRHAPFPAAVVISTFLSASGKFGAAGNSACQLSKYGPKKPKHLLKEGELSALFGPPRWQHVLNRIDHLHDGRPLQTFAAQTERPTNASI